MIHHRVRAVLQPVLTNDPLGTRQMSPRDPLSSHAFKGHEKGPVLSTYVVTCFVLSVICTVGWYNGVHLYTPGETDIELSAGHRLRLQEQRGIDSKSPVYFEQFSEYAPTCRRISADEMAFTLVTQSSENRLWLMKHHCDRWKGKISIAVLSNRTREKVSRDMESLWNCAPGQVEVTTLNAPEEDYPVNQLRNLALRQVKTTHFMYTDIDFWVSPNLHDTLMSKDIRKAFAKDYKLALVVPAFQIENGVCEKGSKEKCHQRDLDSMPSTTEQLFPLLKERVITKKWSKHNEYDWRATPFQEKVFPTAHNATLYSKWFQQGLGELVQIPCVQSGVYEPYVATRYCRDMPPFQEIFTGYGQNKATWILQLRRAGYAFYQVGRVFVIHFPHEESKAKEVWKQHPKELKAFWVNPIEQNVTANLQAFKRGQMDKALLEFRRWMIDTMGEETKERTGRCKEWLDQDYRLWVVDDEEKGRLGKVSTK
jgi:hypothetical protein